MSPYSVLVINGISAIVNKSRRKTFLFFIPFLCSLVALNIGSGGSCGSNVGGSSSSDGDIGRGGGGGGSGGSGSNGGRSDSGRGKWRWWGQQQQRNGRWSMLLMLATHD